MPWGKASSSKRRFHKGKEKALENELLQFGALFMCTREQDLEGDTIEDDSEEGEWAYKDQGVSLVVRRLLYTPT